MKLRPIQQNNMYFEYCTQTIVLRRRKDDMEKFIAEKEINLNDQLETLRIVMGIAQTLKKTS